MTERLGEEVPRTLVDNELNWELGRDLGTRDEFARLVGIQGTNKGAIETPLSGTTDKEGK